MRAGDSDSTARRKDEHLALCLDEDVSGPGATNGFEAFRFDHEPLPEVDRDAVDTSTQLLGRTLRAPLVIGAMTGGTPRAQSINRVLAEAAERTGVALALGSQRKMLEDPDATATYVVRDVAPSVLLFGNLGAVQLNLGVGAAELTHLVEAVGADALFLHLNPLQEAIQPEGDTCFAGLAARIREVAPRVGVPVLLKEVGAGVGEVSAWRMASLPIAGVEVAGAGGTSWARIEAMRAGDRVRATTGERLSAWGVSTAQSLLNCRRAMPERVVIASGGMRTGLDVAKALALGANAVAMALPMLRAARDGVGAVIEVIEQVVDELRTVMFVTGCAKLSHLRTRARLRRVDLCSLP